MQKDIFFLIQGFRTGLRMELRDESVTNTFLNPCYNICWKVNKQLCSYMHNNRPFGDPKKNT